MKKIILSLMIILLFSQFGLKAMEIYKEEIICTFPYIYLNSDTEYSNLSEKTKFEKAYIVKEKFKFNYIFLGTIKNNFYLMNIYEEKVIFYKYELNGTYIDKVKTNINSGNYSKGFIIDNKIIITTSNWNTPNSDVYVYSKDLNLLHSVCLVIGYFVILLLQ
jgi:hypothetical protein